MHGSRVLLCVTALLASLSLVFARTGDAQEPTSVGAPPQCEYGYYGYPPYACAPHGFYGPGYFYKGIFLGVGPWANWGYTHGWGDHRFDRGGDRRSVVASTEPQSNHVEVPDAAHAAPAAVHTPAAPHALSATHLAAAHAMVAANHAGSAGSTHGGVAAHPGGAAHGASAKNASSQRRSVPPLW